MRSDSELLILFFDLKKGWAYAVRFCKIRRDKIGFEMAQVVDSKSDHSTHRIINKSKNGFRLESSKNLAERSQYSSSTSYTRKYEYE